MGVYGSYRSQIHANVVSPVVGGRSCRALVMVKSWTFSRTVRILFGGILLFRLFFIGFVPTHSLRQSI